MGTFLKSFDNLIEHGDVKANQPVAVDTGKNLFAGLRAALG
ncbi:MAG TPA: hypothetical protein VK633_10855 [Verrucomicrobiae bacterium]|nr:hypothetical protein [Verrucomicrobiae bacterium]